jgi:zinc transport system permease protein
VGRRQDLALFLVFALIVALGIKFVGALLMGALTIIPAAIAKNVSRSMRGYMVSSAFLGGIITVTGVWIADFLEFPPGPSIILLGVVMVLASLMFTRVSG